MHDIDDEAVRTRLKEVLEKLGSLKKAGELADVTSDQVARWRDGHARIPFRQVAILCSAAGKSLDWLATGEEPAADMAQMMTQTVLQQSLAHQDVAMISRLNVKLSAGIGRENAEEEQAEQVPISRKLLRRLAIRPENAHIVEADGDSMEDEIFDKDDVLIDMGENRPASEGIYAAVWGELGMLKRLQPVASMGVIRVISDNPRYEPQAVKMDDPTFRVIGKAKLVMRAL